jgi:hypothetical protein
MNGAELPNGSVLRVEPAISKNYNAQNSSPLPDALTPEETIVKEKEEEFHIASPREQWREISHEPNGSDDLDEFFESL